MSICHNCGYEAEGNPIFCEACGAPLNVYTFRRNMRKRRKRMIIIIAVSAIAIIAMMAALTALINPSGRTNTDGQDTEETAPPETTASDTTAADDIEVENEVDIWAEWVGDHPMEKQWTGEADGIMLKLLISEYNEDRSFSGKVTVTYPEAEKTVSADVSTIPEGNVYYLKFYLEETLTWMSFSIRNDGSIYCEITPLQGEGKYFVLK